MSVKGLTTLSFFHPRVTSAMKVRTDERRAGMLVLSRKPNETIVFETSDGPITIHVKKCFTGRVSIGCLAPKNVRVARGEIVNGPMHIQQERVTGGQDSADMPAATKEVGSKKVSVPEA